VDGREWKGIVSHVIQRWKDRADHDVIVGNTSDGGRVSGNEQAFRSLPFLGNLPSDRALGSE
jgi:hypothetical protein